MTTKFRIRSSQDGRQGLELYRIASRRSFSLPLSSLLDQATHHEEAAADVGDDLAEIKHLQVRRAVESLIFDGPEGDT